MSDQATFAPFNKISDDARVVVISEGEEPVACGCYRPLKDAVEIKRMYVKPAFRGKGLAKIILSELESWAQAEGYDYAKLETGDKQPEAVGLYKAVGYTVIENYEPYIGIKYSICMGKELNKS